MPSKQSANLQAVTALRALIRRLNPMMGEESRDEVRMEIQRIVDEFEVALISEALAARQARLEGDVKLLLNAGADSEVVRLATQREREDIEQRFEDLRQRGNYWKS
jgi:hypothetical protein